MVSTLFRDPQAQSSVLNALGTLQPRAFGSLNRVESLDSVSNYYLVTPRNFVKINETLMHNYALTLSMVFVVVQSQHGSARFDTVHTSIWNRGCG